MTVPAPAPRENAKASPSPEALVQVEDLKVYFPIRSGVVFES
jgi:hypothetical protein